MRTITVRLPDEAYEQVKHHADTDQVSMNAWIEALLNREDLRRRCEAHERYMANNPDARAFAEKIADSAADELASR